MTYMLRVAVLLIAIGAGLGCDGLSTSDTCHSSLDAYCADTNCLTLVESRTRAQESTTDAAYCYAETGTCGEYVYVATSGGYGGPTEYFDSTGELVGVKVSSDTNEFCDGDSFSKFFGDVPECEHQVTQDFCVPDGQNSCQSDLSEYCGGQECTTLSQSQQQAREFAANNPSFCYAETGICGEYQYVATSGGYGGPTEYFNSDGELIGVRLTSDTNEFCNGDSFSIQYGDVPDCTPEVSEVYCTP